MILQNYRHLYCYRKYQTFYIYHCPPLKFCLEFIYMFVQLLLHWYSLYCRSIWTKKAYKLIKKSIPYHVNFIVIIISKKFYFVSDITVRNKPSVCIFDPFSKSVTFCKTLFIITFSCILMVIISERDFLTNRNSDYLERYPGQPNAYTPSKKSIHSTAFSL